MILDISSRALALPTLLSLAVAPAASPQATAFDIATFTPPAGWQRSDQNGIVQLHSQHTINGRTTYCQIFLFPSHPGTADAAQNFAAEWGRLIAQPFGVDLSRQCLDRLDSRLAAVVQRFRARYGLC
jgi:hypothetical protein